MDDLECDSSDLLEMARLVTEAASMRELVSGAREEVLRGAGAVAQAVKKSGLDQGHDMTAIGASVDFTPPLPLPGLPYKASVTLRFARKDGQDGIHRQCEDEFPPGTSPVEAARILAVSCLCKQHWLGEYPPPPEDDKSFDLEGSDGREFERLLLSADDPTASMLARELPVHRRATEALSSFRWNVERRLQKLAGKFLPEDFSYGMGVRVMARVQDGPELADRKVFLCGVKTLRHGYANELFKDDEEFAVGTFDEIERGEPSVWGKALSSIVGALVRLGMENSFLSPEKIANAQDIVLSSSSEDSCQERDRRAGPSV